MSLPLAYPEKENAVIGYLSMNGFAGIEDYARTRPDAFTHPLASVTFEAAQHLHQVGRTPNTLTIIEAVEGDRELKRDATDAAAEAGLPDWQNYIYGVDTSIAQSFAGGQIVGEYLADISEAAGRRKAADIGRRLAEGEIDRTEAMEALGVIEKGGIGFKPLSLRSPLEILKMEFDPADLLLANGYLVKGSALTILGQGGLGKSRFALQLAVCSILGRDFLGWKTSSAEVKWLFIQTENGCRRLKADLGKMLSGLSKQDLAKLDANLRLHTIEHDEDTFVSLGSETGKARIHQAIKTFPADVVVFDVLRDFSIGDLNNDADMAATCAAIGGVVRQGNPHRIPLIVHHATTGRAGIAKASGFDRSSFGRNSKVLLGWTRAQINLAPHGPDSNDVVIVTSGKANDFEEFKPFAVRLNPDSWQYEPAPDIDVEEWKESIAGKTAGKKSTATLAHVIERARKAGIDGISKTELVKAIMNETGCGKTKAYDLVDEAEGKKAIHRRKSDDFYVCK
jgi:hypothetical protein